MLRASDSDQITFRQQWNPNVAALIGANMPAVRAKALNEVSTKGEPNLRAPALLTALTDPETAIRLQASMEIVKLLVAEDGAIKTNANGKLEPPKGGILEQFIEVCLDPPIDLDQRTDPRRPGQYDPRHGIITTRLMFLRAIQNTSNCLPQTIRYLIQETETACRSEPQLNEIVASMYPTPNNGQRFNVLGFPYQRLPDCLKDKSISKMAALLIVCLAGAAQATNIFANPTTEQLPGKAAQGIHNTASAITCLQELSETIKSLAPKPFKNKWRQ